MRLPISLLILISTAYGADFTTYIGPPSVSQSGGVAAIATDSAGNTYATGSNVLDTYETGINAFVTKLDPAGNIVFTISFGPAGSYANAIAVDPAGNVWVGGQTLAATLPLVNALQSSPSIPEAGFLVKMAPDGTVLYSSYFGGLLGASGVNGIATDQSGNVYVTGFTDAGDFPTTPGLPASPVSASDSAPMIYGVFAAKLNSTGQKILYSTRNRWTATVSFVLATITPWVSGSRWTDRGTRWWPATPAPPICRSTTTGGSGPGAFVFKINAAGNQLVYFTYVGGSVGNSSTPDTAPASPITADASGNAYVVGSANLGFATKLSPAGATIWTAALGTFQPPVANAISLDNSGNVWLTGRKLLWPN